MTIKEKARAYDEAIKVAKEWHTDAQIGFKANLETLFPELKESEDERIRKFLIEDIKDTLSSEDFKYYNQEHTKKLEEALAWLEKQESVGEIVSRCKTSWYNEGKIQGQIEGLSDEEKYQQGWHDALEKQCEQKSADSYCQENCKGFQETGKCFADGDCKSKREAESIDKAEPKFKDWDLFQIPEKEVADEWDGHTPQEAAERLHKYLQRKL